MTLRFLDNISAGESFFHHTAHFDNITSVNISAHDIFYWEGSYYENLDAKLDRLFNNQTSAILWNTSYAIVQATSGVYATVNNLSSSWVSSSNRVQSLSGIWNSTYSTFRATSGIYTSTYSTIQPLTASWDSSTSVVQSASARWNSSYSTVNGISSVYTTVNDTSADWVTISNLVHNSSAAWTEAGTGGGSVSSNNVIGLTESIQSDAHVAYAYNYAVSSLTIPNYYISDIGNGIDKGFTITHNLSSKNLIVQVYDNSNDSQVIPTIQNLTKNTTYLHFNFIPPTNAYRVLIMLVGPRHI